MEPSKKQLRRHMIAQRKTLSIGQQQACAELLCQRFMEHFAERLKQQPLTIAGYWPVNGELSVLPILRQLYATGHHCLLPHVHTGSRLLRFHHWQPDMVMELGAYGIPSPPAGFSMPQPDIILAPLVACDSDGYRLGYGGGYYDTTISHLRLSAKNTPIIGCGYDFQQCKHLPREPHDQPLELLLIPVSS